MINSTAKEETIFANPTWSAFVLLVTILSLFNTTLLLILPLPLDAQIVLGLVNGTISLILWADFFYMLHGAANKRYFMVHDRGWLVLLGSMPYLRILRLIWFWLVLRENGRTFREFLSRIVIKRNAGGTVLFVLFTVIVVFQFSVVFMLNFEETSQGGNINSISDAFWWAFATVTTVGYGDRVPVTNGGRIVAVVLMILGIALFSVITGSLAEWFSVRPGARTTSQRQEEGAISSDAVAEIKQLLVQQEKTYLQTVDQLTARIAELEASLAQRK